MVKYLRKVGNSSAIILDKSLMELAGLEPGDAVQVRVDSGSIFLTPIKPRQTSSADFEATLDKVMRKRHALLRKLAQ